ncbi:MAG: macro domain-containing protein [Planctomycetota bacterium]
MMTGKASDQTDRKPLVSLVDGDVLTVRGDVLICPANPWLNMSGGVNGEILQRGGEPVQRELHSYLEKSGQKSVAPLTVVVTEPGELPFRRIVHAVAIDPFYDTSAEVVEATLRAALREGRLIGRKIVMPALATGYGRLPLAEFARAFWSATSELTSSDLEIVLVLRTSSLIEEFRGYSV